MNQLIYFLGIDLNTCEELQLRQILARVAAFLILVLGVVCLSVFIVLNALYGLIAALMTSLLSTFFLFHLNRLLILSATTDKLPFRNELTEQANTSTNGGIMRGLIISSYITIIISWTRRHAYQLIKYIFLGAIAFFFGLIIYSAFFELYESALSNGVPNGPKGILSLAIKFINSSTILEKMLLSLSVFFILSPMLITDLFLDRHLLRLNYSSVHERPLIQDDRFGSVTAELTIEKRRMERKGERVKHYKGNNNSLGPNYRALMINFINHIYNQ